MSFEKLAPKLLEASVIFFLPIERIQIDLYPIAFIQLRFIYPGRWDEITQTRAFEITEYYDNNGHFINTCPLLISYFTLF